MNLTRNRLALGLLIALGITAQTQAQPDTGKTRDQVKAELVEAMRSGDMLANGESSLKLNELYPQRYPAPAMAPMKRRGEVQAELAEALRTGNILADGESGLMRNELAPQLYPARVVPTGKSRQQVDAELAEAIRTGDMLANGESGLKLNELFPQRYAKTQAAHDMAQETAPQRWAAEPDNTVMQ